MAECRLYAPGERKGNRFIIARGTINGEEREISTHTTDPSLAQQRWDKFAAEVRESDSAPAVSTFGAVADAYADAHGISRADRGYLNALKTVLGHIDIREVRAMHLAEAANLLYPGRAAATRNRQVINPGAAVLHFAAENQLCAYQRVRRFKEPQPLTRRPKQGTQDLLIANTEGPKRVLLTLLKYQGWRITETLDHKWENTDLTQRTFNVYVSKAGVWKAIPMHDAVFEALASMPGQRVGFIFPWRTRSGVYKWLRKLCRDLGVEFTPHMARHDFGGAHREHGATGRDLLDIGTWTDEKSVGRYETAHDEHKRKLIGRL